MDDLDKKLSDLVEKAQDGSFKVAIQKWTSTKPQQTVVNEMGKILKGNQPKAFLAWLLGLEPHDEALNKYKLKNDIIKQSVQAIQKLVNQNDEQVEKELADQNDIKPTDDKEEAFETEEDNEVVETKSGENVEKIETNDKVEEVNEKIKDDNDQEMTNKATEHKKEQKNPAIDEKETIKSADNEQLKEPLDDPEKSIETNKATNKDVKEASSILMLEKKTASLTMMSTTKDNKHLVEENSKKDHHSVEENGKKDHHLMEENGKKDHHSVEEHGKKDHHSVEENGKKVHHSVEENCKKDHHLVKENKENKKTHPEPEKKKLPSEVSQSDKEKRRLKCEMCNSCYEATKKSTISCGNCKVPAHEDCVKKTLNGCDLKSILGKIGGLNLIWLCSDCNSKCKVVVKKDKLKTTSQSTQTSRSHEKENRSHTKKESKEDKNSQKKDEEKTTEEKVNSIRRKLEKGLESGGSNKKTLELLQSLEKLSDSNTFLAESINLSILTSTKIGWTINDVRKNSTDYDVVELAIRLIKKWKKIVPENYRGNEVEETPKKKKAVKQNDIKSVLTNLPVDKKENTTVSKIKEKDNKIKTKDTDNGSKMKENKPKQKETIKASFFENIKKDVERKEIKKDFEDDEKSVRKTSRNMLLAAVKGDGSRPEDVKKVDFDNLAASIEEAMFGLSKQVNKQYKNLVRSRVFNIKTNPALRNGLLMENISPVRLVTMSSEEMANTNMKNQRDKFSQEGLDRFVKTFGDMALQGNPDLKITDFKIPKYLAPLTAATGSSPTVSGLPSASKVSDITKAGYYSLK